MSRGYPIDWLRNNARNFQGAPLPPPDQTRAPPGTSDRGFGPRSPKAPYNGPSGKNTPAPGNWRFQERATRQAAYRNEQAAKLARQLARGVRRLPGIFRVIDLGLTGLELLTTRATLPNLSGYELCLTCPGIFEISTWTSFSQLPCSSASCLADIRQDNIAQPLEPDTIHTLSYAGYTNFGWLVYDRRGWWRKTSAAVQQPRFRIGTAVPAPGGYPIDDPREVIKFAPGLNPLRSLPSDFTRPVVNKPLIGDAPDASKRYDPAFGFVPGFSLDPGLDPAPAVPVIPVIRPDYNSPLITLPALVSPGVKVDVDLSPPRTGEIPGKTVELTSGPRGPSISIRSRQAGRRPARRRTKERKFIANPGARQAVRFAFDQLTEFLDAARCADKALPANKRLRVAKGEAKTPQAFAANVYRNLATLDLDKFTACLVQNAFDDRLIALQGQLLAKAKRKQHENGFYSNPVGYETGLLDDLPNQFYEQFGVAPGDQATLVNLLKIAGR